jgi:hypothetical protein
MILVVGGSAKAVKGRLPERSLLPDRHYRTRTSPRQPHRRLADCETDALRLNVHNGLLLSALWDAAFDAGLVSFSDDGGVLRSPGLSESAESALRLSPNLRLPSLDAHRVNLQGHRTKHDY